MKAYVANWQKANPEKCREAARRYYARNKAKCIALLAGLGLALYILIMAEGPDLLDIINRF
jgi:hypothetical protein